MNELYTKDGILITAEMLEKFKTRKEKFLKTYNDVPLLDSGEIDWDSIRNKKKEKRRKFFDKNMKHLHKYSKFPWVEFQCKSLLFMLPGDRKVIFQPSTCFWDVKGKLYYGNASKFLKWFNQQQTQKG